MNVIHVHRTIDSETLQLPELKAFLGKTVKITVAELAPATRTCLDAPLPAVSFDPVALESLKDRLTAEQYNALAAIASAGVPDVDAIRRLRAASMT
jgi:hypothetical protein